MKHSIRSLRLPLVVLLFSCLLLADSSCGKDEPDWLIGYYMAIQSKVSLSLSDVDESQGTSSSNSVDVLSNTVRRMRATLLEAYPRDTRKGNDAEVLAALDNIYRKYKEAYADKEGFTVCVITLYRAKKNGDVVFESTPLATYQFGVLPPNTPDIGM